MRAAVNPAKQAALKSPFNLSSSTIEARVAMGAVTIAVRPAVTTRGSPVANLIIRPAAVIASPNTTPYLSTLADAGYV